MMKCACMIWFLVYEVYCASITKLDQSQHGKYNVQIHLKNLELIAILGDEVLGGSLDDAYQYDYDDPEKPSSTTSTSSTTRTTTTTTTTNPPKPSGTSSTTLSPSVKTSKPTPSNASSRLPTSGSTSLTTKVSIKPNPSNKNSAPILVTTKANHNHTNDVKVHVGGTPKINATIPNTTNLITTTKLPKIESESLSGSTTSSNLLTTPNVTPSSLVKDVVDGTHLDMVSIPVEVQQPHPSHPGPMMGMMMKKCPAGYFRDPMGKCRRIRKPQLPFLQMVHTPGVIKSFQTENSTKRMALNESSSSVSRDATLQTRNPTDK